MATTNGYTNGVNGTHDEPHQLYPRFSDIPAGLDIPVRGEDGDEAVNLDLTELIDETDELCDLLENENAAKNYWITIALAYAKQRKVDIAISILDKGLSAHARGRSEDRLSIMTCLCWLYLDKCRHAPRVKPSQQSQEGDKDDRTKEHFIKAVIPILNEAQKMNPAYPPLAMAQGTLQLLQASMQQAKSAPTSREQSERTILLQQAAMAFDRALGFSGGKNVMALLGKARASFSLGNVQGALQLYQQALDRAPDMLDPDPRIGIGCCLWTLGHKDIAQTAWQRSVELNPDSKIAHALLGLYYLDQSHQYNRTDPEWEPLYKKAMTTHTQTAFKIDGMHALTCANFGDYFLRRKQWVNVERLARRAIEHTDVNAIASDGWYLLALQSHYEGDLSKAADQYNRSDQARGADERGYLPAKFGMAQLRTVMRDFDGAKFRLEKIVERSKSLEAMTLLGVLHAEEVFAAQAAGSKEDKSLETKRAINSLEAVRMAWKDPKRKAQKDAAVLLNLGRLYENDAPEKALSCLKEVEEMQMADISDGDLPEDMGPSEEEEKQARRLLLAPQLLSNIGCFNFQAEKFSEACEYFKTALNASVQQRNTEQLDEEGNAIDDSDALVCTISYNLARTYEAMSMDDQANDVYRSLLVRHPDYIDARTRLAYLSLISNPSEGAEAVKGLLETDPGNMDVRALYGWYVHTAKKRTHALNEDAEQRHYKQTLQSYDKHDLYSLTGMGNLHLAVAREMPRDTDQHKEKRSKMYARAVEFYDKVLTLDPKNAFAAQGMGIAVVEEKRDTAAAIQIFSKVRESVKEASVHVNLGHVFTEVKQYSRAIENYELALVKSREREPGILACLGRVWLVRGRQEKKLDAYKTSLDFSRQALEAAPDNINYRFNIAFVQIQLAQMIISLPEAQKTLVDVEQASQGLDEAIESFGRIAKEPNPPFPRGDIEQRANMGRNTMKRQLASAIERQAEYERNNAERLEEARRKREEEVRKREEEKRLAAEKAEEERRKIREERERIAEEDRQLIQKRMDEEQAREAELWTTDEETGERRKRERKPKEKRQKRKKKSEDSADDDTDAENGKSRPRSGAASATPATGSDAEGGSRRKTKKRKLESRKGRTTGASSKYKSKDIVEESDDEDLEGVAGATASSQPTRDEDRDEDMPETPGADEDGARTPGAMGAEDEDGEERIVSRANQRKKAARILDDDDDEEEGQDQEPEGVAQAGESDHGGD